MIKFEVKLQTQPEKYYGKTDNKTAKVLDPLRNSFLTGLEKCFRQLEDNPFYQPGKIKRLKGREGLFRYTTDGLRIVYEIDVKNRKLGVLTILPRGNIYKRI